MAKLQSKPLMNVLRGDVVTPAPVWLMRQAGRYLPEYREVRTRAGSFLDLCFDPVRAAEVTLQPIRRYGFDAAILFSDILVVPHALGQSVRFEDGEGPRLEPVRREEDLRMLSPDPVHAVPSSLAPVYEAALRVREALSPETALIGFAGAPWTVATYMVEGGTSRDFQEVKRWALAAPESFGKLIDLLVGATVEHLCCQIAAGAEAVQLFESHAGVLPEAAFRHWVIAPTAAVVKTLRKRCPGVPVIGFPRGAGLLYPDYLRGTGVDAVGLDSAVPLHWAASALQPMAAVQGNLDPVLLLAGGDPMTTAANAILDRLGSGPLIFNLGHGVMRETPPENVAALVAHIRGGKKGWQ